MIWEKLLGAIRLARKYDGADVLTRGCDKSESFLFLKIVKSLGYFLLQPHFIRLHCFANWFAKVIEAICYCLEINYL